MFCGSAVRLRRLLTRCLAVLICIVITVQNAQGVETLWSSRPRAPRTEPRQIAALPSAALPPLSAVRAAPAGPAALKPYLAAVPAAAGIVREAAPGRAGRPAVLLVQDIHLNPEAQRNISAILAAWASGTAAAPVIAVEGAFGRFDFKRFRAGEPDRLDVAAADALLEAGVIAAPSHLGLTARRADIEMWGVDDPALYRENEDAVHDARAARPRVEKKLAESEAALEANTRALTPAARGLLEAERSFLAGRLSLGEHALALAARFEDSSSRHVVGRDPEKSGPGQRHSGATALTPELARFVRAYRLERSIDFAAADRERRAAVERWAAHAGEGALRDMLADAAAFREGRMGFADFYRRLAGRLGPDLGRAPAFRLYLDYVAASERVEVGPVLAEVRGLERTLEEREGAATRAVFDVARRAGLLRKLTTFSLTPPEWREIRTAIPADAAFEPFARFYQAADRRSDAMADALAARLDTGRRPAALILGGFHTPEVAARLRERGIAFAVVQPRLTRVDLEGASAYLSAFAREKTPLDRLLDGEKLFLNPNRTAAGTDTTPEVRRTNALVGAVMGAARAIFGGRSVPGVTPDGPGRVRVRLDNGVEAGVAREGAEKRSWRPAGPWFSLKGFGKLRLFSFAPVLALFDSESRLAIFFVTFLTMVAGVFSFGGNAGPRAPPPGPEAPVRAFLRAVGLEKWAVLGGADLERLERVETPDGPAFRRRVALRHMPAGVARIFGAQFAPRTRASLGPVEEIDFLHDDRGRLIAIVPVGTPVMRRTMRIHELSRAMALETDRLTSNWVPEAAARERFIEMGGEADGWDEFLAEVRGLEEDSGITPPAPGLVHPEAFVDVVYRLPSVQQVNRLGGVFELKPILLVDSHFVPRQPGTAPADELVREWVEHERDAERVSRVIDAVLADSPLAKYYKGPFPSHFDQMNGGLLHTERSPSDAFAFIHVIPDPAGGPPRVEIATLEAAAYDASLSGRRELRPALDALTSPPGPGEFKFIIPVLPTVYNPGRHGVSIADKGYHEALLNVGQVFERTMGRPLTAADNRVFVNGAGSGADSITAFLGWMRATGQTPFGAGAVAPAIDIWDVNPFARENALLMGTWLGIPVRAAEPSATEHHDLFVQNRPSYSPFILRDPTAFETPFERLHDGVTAETLLHDIRFYREKLRGGRTLGIFWDAEFHEGEGDFEAAERNQTQFMPAKPGKEQIAVVRTTLENGGAELGRWANRVAARAAPRRLHVEVLHEELGLPEDAVFVTWAVRSLEADDRPARSGGIGSTVMLLAIFLVLFLPGTAFASVAGPVGMTPVLPLAAVGVGLTFVLGRILAMIPSRGVDHIPVEGLGGMVDLLKEALAAVDTPSRLRTTLDVFWGADPRGTLVDLLVIEFVGTRMLSKEMSADDFDAYAGVLMDFLADVPDRAVSRRQLEIIARTLLTRSLGLWAVADGRPGFTHYRGHPFHPDAVAARNTAFLRRVAGIIESGPLEMADVWRQAVIGLATNQHAMHVLATGIPSETLAMARHRVVDEAGRAMLAHVVADAIAMPAERVQILEWARPALERLLGRDAVAWAYPRILDPAAGPSHLIYLYALWRMVCTTGPLQTAREQRWWDRAVTDYENGARWRGSDALPIEIEVMRGDGFGDTELGIQAMDFFRYFDPGRQIVLAFQSDLNDYPETASGHGGREDRYTEVQSPAEKLLILFGLDGRVRDPEHAAYTGFPRRALHVSGREGLHPKEQYVVFPTVRSVGVGRNESLLQEEDDQPHVTLSITAPLSVRGPPADGSSGRQGHVVLGNHDSWLIQNNHRRTAGLKFPPMVYLAPDLGSSAGFPLFLTPEDRLVTAKPAKASFRGDPAWPEFDGRPDDFFDAPWVFVYWGPGDDGQAVRLINAALARGETVLLKTSPGEFAKQRARFTDPGRIVVIGHKQRDDMARLMEAADIIEAAGTGTLRRAIMIMAAHGTPVAYLAPYWHGDTIPNLIEFIQTTPGLDMYDRSRLLSFYASQYPDLLSNGEEVDMPSLEVLRPSFKKLGKLLLENDAGPRLAAMLAAAQMWGARGEATGDAGEFNSAFPVPGRIVRSPRGAPAPVVVKFTEEAFAAGLTEESAELVAAAVSRAATPAGLVEFGRSFYFPMPSGEVRAGGRRFARIKAKFVTYRGRIPDGSAYSPEGGAEVRQPTDIVEVDAAGRVHHAPGHVSPMGGGTLGGVVIPDFQGTLEAFQRGHRTSYPIGVGQFVGRYFGEERSPLGFVVYATIEDEETRYPAQMTDVLRRQQSRGMPVVREALLRTAAYLGALHRSGMVHRQPHLNQFHDGPDGMWMVDFTQARTSRQLTVPQLAVLMLRDFVAGYDEAYDAFPTAALDPDEGVRDWARSYFAAVGAPEAVIADASIYEYEGLLPVIRDVMSASREDVLAIDHPIIPVFTRLAAQIKPATAAPLTRDSTRRLAEKMGLDPAGAVAEILVASIREGFFFEHFNPIFPLLHEKQSWHQWMGMAAIWGFAIAAVALFGTGYVDSAFWFWLGGMAGHAFYNAAARVFGWARLALSRGGERWPTLSVRAVRLSDAEMETYFGRDRAAAFRAEGREFYLRNMSDERDDRLLARWRSDIDADAEWRARWAARTGREPDLPKFSRFDGNAVGLVSVVNGRERLEGFFTGRAMIAGERAGRRIYSFYQSRREIYYRNISNGGERDLPGVADLLWDYLAKLVVEDGWFAGGVSYSAETPGSRTFGERNGLTEEGAEMHAPLSLLERRYEERALSQRFRDTVGAARIEDVPAYRFLEAAGLQEWFRLTREQAQGLAMRPSPDGNLYVRPVRVADLPAAVADFMRAQFSDGSRSATGGAEALHLLYDEHGRLVAIIPLADPTRRRADRIAEVADRMRGDLEAHTFTPFLDEAAARVRFNRLGGAADAWPALWARLLDFSEANPERPAGQVDIRVLDTTLLALPHVRQAEEIRDRIDFRPIYLLDAYFVPPQPGAVSPAEARRRWQLHEAWALGLSARIDAHMRGLPLYRHYRPAINYPDESDPDSVGRGPSRPSNGFTFIRVRRDEKGRMAAEISRVDIDNFQEENRWGPAFDDMTAPAAPGEFKVIIPVLPTVYNAGRSSIFAADRGYHRQLLRLDQVFEYMMGGKLTVDDDEIFIDGVGSGADMVTAYIGWMLATGQTPFDPSATPPAIEIGDINPIARANALLVGRLLGIPVAEGNHSRRYRIVIQNRPAFNINARSDARAGGRPLEAHHDNITAASLLEDARRYRRMLAGGRTLLIIWDAEYYEGEGSMAAARERGDVHMAPAKDVPQVPVVRTTIERGGEVLTRWGNVSEWEHLPQVLEGKVLHLEMSLKKQAVYATTAFRSVELPTPASLLYLLLLRIGFSPRSPWVVAAGLAGAAAEGLALTCLVDPSFGLFVAWVAAHFLLGLAAMTRKGSPLGGVIWIVGLYFQGFVFGLYAAAVSSGDPVLMGAALFFHLAGDAFIMDATRRDNSALLRTRNGREGVPRYMLHSKTPVETPAPDLRTDEEKMRAGVDEAIRLAFMEGWDDNGELQLWNGRGIFAEPKDGAAADAFLDRAEYLIFEQKAPADRLANRDTFIRVALSGLVDIVRNQLSAAVAESADADAVAAARRRVLRVADIFERTLAIYGGSDTELSRHVVRQGVLAHHFMWAYRPDTAMRAVTAPVVEALRERGGRFWAMSWLRELKGENSASLITAAPAISVLLDHLGRFRPAARTVLAYVLSDMVARPRARQAILDWLAPLWVAMGPAGESALRLVERIRSSAGDTEALLWAEILRRHVFSGRLALTDADLVAAEDAVRAALRGQLAPSSTVVFEVGDYDNYGDLMQAVDTARGYASRGVRCIVVLHDKAYPSRASRRADVPMIEKAAHVLGLAGPVTSPVVVDGVTYVGAPHRDEALPVREPLQMIRFPGSAMSHQFHHDSRLRGVIHLSEHDAPTVEPRRMSGDTSGPAHPWALPLAQGLGVGEAGLPLVSASYFPVGQRPMKADVLPEVPADKPWLFVYWSSIKGREREKYLEQIAEYARAGWVILLRGLEPGDLSAIVPEASVFAVPGGAKAGLVRVAAASDMVFVTGTMSYVDAIAAAAAYGTPFAYMNPGWHSATVRNLLERVSADPELRDDFPRLARILNNPDEFPRESAALAGRTREVFGRLGRRLMGSGSSTDVALAAIAVGDWAVGRWGGSEETFLEETWWSQGSTLLPALTTPATLRAALRVADAIDDAAAGLGWPVRLSASPLWVRAFTLVWEAPQFLRPVRFFRAHADRTWLTALGIAGVLLLTLAAGVLVAVFGPGEEAVARVLWSLGAALAANVAAHGAWLALSRPVVNAADLVRWQRMRHAVRNHPSDLRAAVREALPAIEPLGVGDAAGPMAWRQALAAYSGETTVPADVTPAEAMLAADLLLRTGPDASLALADVMAVDPMAEGGLSIRVMPEGPGRAAAARRMARHMNAADQAVLVVENEAARAELERELAGDRRFFVRVDDGSLRFDADSLSSLTGRRAWRRVNVFASIRAPLSEAAMRSLEELGRTPGVRLDVYMLLENALETAVRISITEMMALAIARERLVATQA